MWTMGDVLLSMYEELDACGLDKYGRPKNPVPTVLNADIITLFLRAGASSFRT